MKNDEPGGASIRRRVLSSLIVLVMVAAVMLFAVGPGVSWLMGLVEWIDGAGIAGAVVFGTVFAVGTALFLPAALFMISAGFLFGLVGGGIVSSLATTVGAVLAFLVSRYLAREAAQSWLGEIRIFKAIERAVSREGFKMAFLTRLVPILPFGVLNYIFGLTRVRVLPFTVATWLGMIPISMAYVALGAATGDLSRALAKERSLDSTTVVLALASAVALAAILWLILRRARQELEMMMEE